VAVDGLEVTTLGPGDSFGEVALLRDGTRTATVTARTAAVLWELEGSRFVATLGGGDGHALATADQLVGALLQRARPGTDVPEERAGRGAARGVTDDLRRAVVPGTARER
jgi:CRP-like cAMP-binding protein